MSTKPSIFRGPALWTLIAGVAIGAGSMYSVFSGHGGSLAIAQVDLPKARTASITKSESLATLKALDSGFATLAEYASPAVVLIKSENNKPQPGLTGMGNIVRGGEGSGVIFRPDGYIVTNDHVVGGFDKVTVVLKDGREFPGKVTRAQTNDIAVVKIDATNLPTLPFADSTKVKPGQFAMAIGAPYGLDNSVTIGHVSALNRQNDIQDPISGEDRFYPELIQTDASINMGNSGGPLIDVDGEVIGINSSIISPPGGNGGGVGLGFAISSNQARLLAETLIKDGKITRAYLGLIPFDLKEVQKTKLHITSGALVEMVSSDGPAAAAGIKKDDVVIRIGSIPVTDQIDLRNAMLKYKPGTTVDVEIVRDGANKTFSVKLAVPPARPQAQRLQPQDNGGPNFKFFGPDDGSNPDLKEFMKQYRDRLGNPDGSGPSMPHVGHAILGVQVHDIDDNARKQFNIPGRAKGAVVATVQPGSVAEHLGIKTGDVIESLGDTQITSAASLSEAMSGVRWGDAKSITYVRWTGQGVQRVTTSVPFK